MKRTVAVLSLAWIALVAIACQDEGSSGDTVQAAEEGDAVQAAEEGDARAARTGMTVYRDPVSGEFGPPPAGVDPAALAGELGHRTDSSGDGLVETPSPVPGGGVLVRTGGRFQNFVRATVDEQGGVRNDCSTLAEDSPEKAEARP